MKFILMMAAVTVALFTGCTSPNAGRPGDDAYRVRDSDSAESNDRVSQKSHINLRQGWNH